MSSSTADCGICCNSFTSNLRRKVICPFCKFSTCLECVKKYVLTSYEDPNCMNCHVPWTLDFVDGVFSKNFRNNEYKKHREDILLEREKSLLPSTMPYVEEERRRRELQDENTNLYAKRNALLLQIDEIDMMIDNNLNMINRSLSGESQERDKKEFVRACVISGCRGFLSTQWKCGVCATWVCPQCHEPKSCQNDTEHHCDPNNVETAKLLEKDTKPCPKCASLIHKVSGCDLMFCTICHVSFSWKSGSIVNPVNNHNPHYLDYVRRENNGVVPRAPGDIPLACGGFPDVWTLNRYCSKNVSYDPDRMPKIVDLWRILNHVLDYEVHQQRIPIMEEVNLGYRVKYIMNEMTEEEWKRQLQKQEKKNNFKIAKRQVYEMLVTVASELFNQLIQAKKKEVCLNIIDEIERLLSYFNESIVSVFSRFGSKAVKTFDNEWKLL